MTFALPRRLADQMRAHAQQDHPIEACGVVLGKDGCAREVLPLTNVAASATFYEVDSRELLGLYQRLDATGLQLLAIYHSHTSTPAYPSVTDVALAFEPYSYYLLLSTAQPEVVMAAFRIVAGAVEPVELEIVTDMQGTDTQGT